MAVGCPRRCRRRRSKAMASAGRWHRWSRRPCNCAIRAHHVMWWSQADDVPVDPAVSWSQGEAYLSAQHTPSCPQARLSAPHVDACRPVDREGSSPSRSYPAVGLSRPNPIVPTPVVGTTRCWNGSHTARCSQVLHRRHPATAPAFSRWSSRRALRVTDMVQDSQWPSVARSAPRWSGIDFDASCVPHPSNWTALAHGQTAGTW